MRFYDFPSQAQSLRMAYMCVEPESSSPWVAEKARETLGNYPVLGRDGARAFRHAELAEIPGVGRLPQVEACDRNFERLVGFLTSAHDHSEQPNNRRKVRT